MYSWAWKRIFIYTDVKEDSADCRMRWVALGVVEMLTSRWSSELQHEYKFSDDVLTITDRQAVIYGVMAMASLLYASKSL